MLLITGTFRIAPESLGHASPIMLRMIEASRAESGCIAYSYAQDLLDPGLIRVHEIWRDRIALEQHFTTSHIAEWRANWPQLGIGERNLMRYPLGDGEPT